MLSSLLMTINCFILHTPDLKFADSARLLFFLTSNVSHRMLEVAGKAAGTPATTQGQDLVGLISAHSWLKYTVLQCRKTWKTLWHLWAVISAYTDWISKHQDKIWHFSFNNLTLHVNALKLKTNIGGGNFLHGKRCCKVSGFGFVSKWHMLFCETTDTDTCPQAAALSGPRNMRGRTALLWHHSHFSFLLFISCLLSFSWHFLSYTVCDHTAWGASSPHRNRKVE